MRGEGGTIGRDGTLGMGMGMEVVMEYGLVVMVVGDGRFLWLEGKGRGKVGYDRGQASFEGA